MNIKWADKGVQDCCAKAPVCWLVCNMSNGALIVQVCQKHVDSIKPRPTDHQVILDHRPTDDELAVFEIQWS